MARAVSLLLVTVLTGCAAGTEPVEPGGSPYVLVLGTAQDGGLPQIGAEHALAQAAREDPARRRLVASLLIVDPRGGKRWLVDATPDIREQVERSRGRPATRKPIGPRPPLFEGVFLTHAHIGHYTGLVHLGREVYGAKELPVYASRRMTRFLETNGPWSLLVENRNVVLEPIDPGQTVELAEGLTVRPLDVPHRDEFTDTFGYVIRGPSKSVLYIPDIDKWESWDRRIEDEIAAVDHVLIDGTFFEEGEIPGRSMAEIPHPFIVESLRRFESLPENERRKVHFTHLNHTNPASDPAGKAVARVRRAGCAIAYEGQILDL